MPNARWLLPVCSVLSWLTACGGADFENDIGAPDKATPFEPALVSDDPVGTNAACVTAMRSASLPTVNLVMMVDKSGSMGNPNEGGDPRIKWIPVNTGIKSFFADSASAGYAASLQFFPAPGDVATTCAAPYETPIVGLTPLSKHEPLVRAIDSATPTGGTPTLPALKGALAFAQKTAKQRPDEKTVVVLVTDGEPGMMVDGKFVPGCANNDIANVSAAAAAALQAAPAIPTYVIGVGPSLSKLDAVAQAGGTGKAFMVSVENPNETTTQLRQALESIRSAVKVGCDFPLPAPPPGQRLDPKRVNVAISAGSNVTPLVYSRDCSAENGWRYDDLGAPTRVTLCPASCSRAQASADNQLTVAFGCATNGVPR